MAAKPSAWPPLARIRRHVEFQHAYRAGRRRRSPHFLWVIAPMPASQTSPPASRFGIAVSRRTGGAVVRNRVKRRTRELLRRARAFCPPGWRIVVLPQTAVLQTDFASLETEVRGLLRELGRSPG